MTSVTRKSQDVRSRRDAAETDVFAALQRLLSEGVPFTELGVQRIAEEAGIGRSTFYVHFADKTELLIRFGEAATQDLFSVAGRWTQSWEREDLERTMLEVIRERRTHAPALRALAEVGAYDPQVAQAWRAMVASNVELIKARIERDQSQGLTSSEVDAELTAAYVTWGVERMVGQHVDSEGPATDESVAAAMARVVWAAMYGRLDD